MSHMDLPSFKLASTAQCFLSPGISHWLWFWTSCFAPALCGAAGHDSWLNSHVVLFQIDVVVSVVSVAAAAAAAGVRPPPRRHVGWSADVFSLAFKLHSPRVNSIIFFFSYLPTYEVHSKVEWSCRERAREQTFIFPDVPQMGLDSPDLCGRV